MKKQTLQRTALALVLAAVALSSGCASRTPATNFYVLAAEASASPIAGTYRTQVSNSAAVADLAIGVGPVELPAYLDRPQIVTRAGNNSLDFAEFNQWAEPLDENFTAALADNLEQMVPVNRVVVFPWKHSVTIDYQVVVDVARFESQAGEVQLSARWSIVSGSDGEEITAHKISLREPTSDQNAASQVAALNRALAKLSREIASVVQKTSRQSRGSQGRSLAQNAHIASALPE